MGTTIALQLLFGLLDRVETISSLLKVAQAEGRDITDEELDQLQVDYDAANAKLTQAIADARK